MSQAKHVRELIASRRAVLGALAGLPLLELSLAGNAHATLGPARPPTFASVARTNADTVTVPVGYRAQTLIAWGDRLFESVSASVDLDGLTRAEQEQRFGQNNDMLALFPSRYAFPWPTDQADLILCANHEYGDPALLFPSARALGELTPAQWEAAYAAFGIAVVQVTHVNGAWRVRTDPAPGRGLNRRITPFTPVLFSGPAARHRWISAAAPVVNAAESERSEAAQGAVRCGTLANCSGGRTPWGTYLSSEENFDGFFTLSDANAAPLAAAQADQAWIWDAGKFGYPLYSGGTSRGLRPPTQFDVSHNPYGPALYGWVVEVDPYDPHWTPRKRTALGRKKGECATTALAADGRVVCYMGDDQIDEFLYKFVSAGRFNANDRLANRDLLDEGKLYAAKLNEDGTGEWLELSVAAANRAQADAPYHAPFADYGDVVMRAREAARLLGATAMDRPEDFEAPVDANWRGQGVALVTCTYNRNEEFYRPGNPRRGAAQREHMQQANVGGHILRIDEADGDNAATHFRWDVFALCGDPDAEANFTLPGGVAADVSVTLDGAPTFSGDRFTCPDNICFDTAQNVWIATDGSPAVFPDCNDCVVVAPVNAPAPRPVKRFLVGPVGCEICGPTLSPDESAFLCAIQHPGESDLQNTPIAQLRWAQGHKPPSHWPDGGDSWPRSAVVVVTREDGGKVGA
ncbi:MAG TPA: alkaline phosphatase PhoX [Caulobacterales bacterium]|nr:alkaline phosphatase PhoX [Caulobacterales bacterium]